MLYIDGKLHLKDPRTAWQLLHAASQPLQDERKVTRPAPAWVAPHHPHRSTLFEEGLCTFLLGRHAVVAKRVPHILDSPTQQYPRLLRRIHAMATVSTGHVSTSSVRSTIRTNTPRRASCCRLHTAEVFRQLMHDAREIDPRAVDSVASPALYE